MKCACGYERLESWQTEDGVAVGDENFEVLDFGLYPQIYVGMGDYEKKTIYVCPKCGTLKIEL